MGKSYKKTPVVTDNAHSHESKKKASRRVRRKLKQNGDVVLSGNSYKKMHESWDICDYKFMMTEEDAIDNYYRYLKEDELHGVDFTIKRYPTLESFLNWWRKKYKSK